MKPRVIISRRAEFSTHQSCGAKISVGYAAEFILDGDEFKSAVPASCAQAHEINSAIYRLIDFVDSVALELKP